MSEAEALYREALQGRRKVLGNLDATKIHGEANVGGVAYFFGSRWRRTKNVGVPLGIPNGIFPQQSNELTPKMAICKNESTGLTRLPSFWGPPAVSFRGCIIALCIFGVFLVKTHCFIKDVQIKFPGDSYRITVLDLQFVSPATICQKKHVLAQHCPTAKGEK